jgi:hypothetical protein
MLNVRGSTTTYQLDYDEITLLLFIDIMMIIVELLFQIRSCRIISSYLALEELQSLFLPTT